MDRLALASSRLRLVVRRCSPLALAATLASAGLLACQVDASSELLVVRDAGSGEPTGDGAIAAPDGASPAPGSDAGGATKDAASPGADAAPPPSSGDGGSGSGAVAGSIVIDPGGRFATYYVSPAEFAGWNGEALTSPAGLARLRNGTEGAFSILRDEFQFVIFALANGETPAGRPMGESVHVKNDVRGLGLSSFDDSASYGSSGKLELVSVLYQLTLKDPSSPELYSFVWLGPTTHELGHRWFAFATDGAPHWPAYNVGGDWTLPTSGIFANPGHDYAEVELYAMGLLRPEEISNSADALLYQQMLAKAGPRAPDAAASPKSFRGLVIVVTPTALDAATIQATNEGIDGLTSTAAGAWGVNFHRQTRGRATLKLDGLLDVRR